MEASTVDTCIYLYGIISRGCLISRERDQICNIEGLYDYLVEVESVLHAHMSPTTFNVIRANEASGFSRVLHAIFPNVNFRDLHVTIYDCYGRRLSGLSPPPLKVELDENPTENQRNHTALQNQKVTERWSNRKYCLIATACLAAVLILGLGLRLGLGLQKHHSIRLVSPI